MTEIIYDERTNKCNVSYGSPESLISNVKHGSNEIIVMNFMCNKNQNKLTRN